MIPDHKSNSFIKNPARACLKRPHYGCTTTLSGSEIKEIFNLDDVENEKIEDAETYELTCSSFNGIDEFSEQLENFKHRQLISNAAPTT